MNCTICGKALTNGLDTFGDVGSEVCWDCWLDLPNEDECYEWYGMAPHYHDMSITGSVIGSTVMLEYPLNADGVYEPEPGLTFVPDAEVDGTAGIWRDCRPEPPEAVIVPDDQLDLFGGEA